MTASTVPPLPALPARPIKQARKRAVIRPLIGWLVAAIAFVAIGVFMAWNYGPQLAREVALRHGGATTQQARLVDGVCKTRKAIFTDCSGHFEFLTRPEHGQQLVKAKLDYLMMLSLDDDIPLTVTYDPARPQVNTTSWGQNHLWNRVGTLAGMVLFCVGMGPLFVVLAFTPMRRERALRAALQKPKAGAVRLSNLRSAGRRLTLKVHFKRGGKWRAFDHVMFKDESPLMLGETDRALAVMSPDGIPHVLDTGLADLALSTQEREQIQRAAQTWPD